MARGQRRFGSAVLLAPWLSAPWHPFSHGLEERGCFQKNVTLLSFEEDFCCNITRENGADISLQLHYLFEALAFIEEEIATCFLKKCFWCNMRWWKVRSFLNFPGEVA